MDVVADELTFRRQVLIEAPRETVWEFLVDPVKVVRWMGLDAALDARPGGQYRVEVLPGDVASGAFVEVDPPSRLVHTWGWSAGGRADMPPGASTVEFELLPEGDSTLLLLTHRRLPTPAAAAGHGRGWNHYLERLGRLAVGDEPGPDPWVAEGPPMRPRATAE